MAYDPGSTEPAWQGGTPPPPSGVQPPPEEPKRDWLPIVLAAIALLLALGGIIVAIVALSQQEETAQEIGLAQGVVTAATIGASAVTAGKIAESAVEEGTIADGAVSESKIADGAVTEPKIADRAVTRSKIAPESITGGKVENDSLTGQQIAESTLETVPSAEVAETAKVAESLADGEDGGQAPSLEFQIQQASSDNTPTDAKSVDASCPEGAASVGGGAAIVGEDTQPPAALTVSVRTDSGWTAQAREYADFDENWRLDVVAVCAIFEAGGSGS